MPLEDGVAMVVGISPGTLDLPSNQSIARTIYCIYNKYHTCASKKIFVLYKM